MIKKKILSALNSDKILNLTGDKKVYFIHANNPKNPYIEYEVINSVSSDYSEGWIDYINHLIQVDIFSDKDYTELETTIVNEMINRGFELEPGSPDLYEKETHLFHKPLRFNIDLATS